MVETSLYFCPLEDILSSLLFFFYVLVSLTPEFTFYCDPRSLAVASMSIGFFRSGGLNGFEIEAGASFNACCPKSEDSCFVRVAALGFLNLCREFSCESGVMCFEIFL